jgi:hypothetical protein
MKKFFLTVCLAVFVLGSIVGCKPAPAEKKAPAEQAAADQAEVKAPAPAGTVEK